MERADQRDQSDQPLLCAVLSDGPCLLRPRRSAHGARYRQVCLELARMITPGTRSLRRWGFVHKWTSLICTLFMLLLCITGLPLIFHHEIDDLLHSHVEAA